MRIHVEKTYAPPFPLQRRRRTTLGKFLRKASRPQETIHLERVVRNRARITSKEIAQLHCVASSRVREIAKHKQAANSAKSVRFHTEKQSASHIKERKRVEEKAQ